MALNKTAYILETGDRRLASRQINSMIFLGLYAMQKVTVFPVSGAEEPGQEGLLGRGRKAET